MKFKKCLGLIIYIDFGILCVIDAVKGGCCNGHLRILTVSEFPFLWLVWYALLNGVMARDWFGRKLAKPISLGLGNRNRIKMVRTGTETECLC